MLDDNLLPALTAVDYAKREQSRIVELDAIDVVTLQPSAACLIAVAARSVRESGRTLRIARLRPQLRPLIQQLDAAIELVGAGSEGPPAPAPGEETSISIQIHNARDANAEANRLATYIAQFIPREDQAEMLRDLYGVRIHHAIQPALAHILAELVDNVFSHAATEEYRSPHAYMAVQSYPAGDLLRVAVVDDGCGLLGSLRALPENPPRNHYDAATRAFEPFVSSKKSLAIYAERRHMGLGLPVCREICQQLGGRIHAATGNAWIQDPGLSTQTNRQADPFFQGTLICLAGC
ncbi:MAG TPA: ATP-binding protein [Steroidobacteraceae bacterium]|nr:ATP-binding protein [Steroidobacteraceae bacterium]